METNFYLVHWHKGQNWNDSKSIGEQNGIQEHLQFLMNTSEDGHTIVSGIKEEEIGGVAILQFDNRQTITNHLLDDPCIKNGVMTFEIIPFNPINWNKGIHNGINFFNHPLEIAKL